MFKDPKQRKFLFALDKDKQTGQPQQNHLGQPSQVLTNPLNGALKTDALNKLKLNKVPEPTPPAISPTAVPALPQLGRLPKFGKLRNSLKNQANKFIK